MSKPHQHPSETRGTRQSVPPPPPHQTRAFLRAQEKRDAEIDKSLQAIYTHGAAGADLARLDRRPAWFMWHRVCAVIFSLGLVTLGALAALLWLKPLLQGCPQCWSCVCKVRRRSR